MWRRKPTTGKHINTIRVAHSRKDGQEKTERVRARTLLRGPIPGLSPLLKALMGEIFFRKEDKKRTTAGFRKEKKKGKGSHS